ncbi:MAG: TIGR02186 family protein [Pseudomonadota bacterium]
MKKLLMSFSLLIVFVLFGGSSQAALSGPGLGNDAVTSCTKDHIDVDLRYSGDKVYFFGTVPEKGAHVIVKLISTTKEPVKLSQKGKVGIFWMGVKQYKVTNMPLIYKIHSSGKLSEILTPELATQLGIGYESLKDNMQLELIKGEGSKDTDLVFDGLLKVKEKENLYKIAEGRIQITQDKIFQHYFTFPPRAGEGDYKVLSYIVKDGKLLATCSDRVMIRKVGLGKWLSQTAEKNGILYGIMCVAVAASAGLCVGMIFKGGGH